MTRSHSLVADAWDLVMANANRRRRIVEFGQWRDLAMLPPLQAAEPHGEVFDPALARREREETNPASFCRMGAPERERDEGGRKRYEKIGACFCVTPLRNWGIISRNHEISQLFAGELKRQRLSRGAGHR